MQPQRTNPVVNHLVGANTAPRFDAEAVHKARPVKPLRGRTWRLFTASLSHAVSLIAYHSRQAASLLVIALISGIGLGQLLNQHGPEPTSAPATFTSQPVPDTASTLADLPAPTPSQLPLKKGKIKVNAEVEEQNIPRDKGFKKGFKKLGNGALKVLKLPGKLK